MRIAIGIEYKGSGFNGWQSQDGVRTAQDCIEKALSLVADHPIRVVAAGRTDTGVHATGQVVHFDTERSRSSYSWTRGANSHLPNDVRVLWAKQVPSGFHARFSAAARSYRYILHVSSSRPAILGELCAWVYYDLNVKPMQKAAQLLVGEHDFSSFRAAGCQAKTPCRKVTDIDLNRAGCWLWLDITADAFLQHMIRNIVGSLILVGRGERRPEWMTQVLERRDRTLAGATASPAGLYLSKVFYPPAFDIPAPASRARFW